jgi:hypothetical protein
MRKALRRRFWLEVGLASVTGALVVLSLLWYDWVEVIFFPGPDNDHGLLEWLSGATFVMLTAMLSLLARYEWLRARDASS